jgi:hypothetical protein
MSKKREVEMLDPQDRFLEKNMRRQRRERKLKEKKYVRMNGQR